MPELKMPKRLTLPTISEQCPGCDNSIWLNLNDSRDFGETLAFTGYCFVCQLGISLTVGLREKDVVDS